MTKASKEITARQQVLNAGWTFTWEHDETGHLSLAEGEALSEVLCVALRDADGQVRASLCGIADPTREYGLHVENELADEALAQRVYYTVTIPPVGDAAYLTQWHSESGQTLTRGKFQTWGEATRWAIAHLGGTPYSVSKYYA